MKGFLPSLVVGALIMGSATAGEDATQGFRVISGGDFQSAVRMEREIIHVAPYALMDRPVSNTQFLDFLTRHPKWSPENIPSVFSSPGYITHWKDTSSLSPEAPASRVSWYAAQAYCQSIDARLPSFVEWEFAAAASATQQDARSNPQRRRQLAHDGTSLAMDDAQSPPNAYGIHELHSGNWEWVEDQSSLLGQGDRRGQSDGNAMRYCGAASLTFRDPSDYAVVKRFSLLSALSPQETLGNLGFRCAKSLPSSIQGFL